MQNQNEFKFELDEHGSLQAVSLRTDGKRSRACSDNIQLIKAPHKLRDKQSQTVSPISTLF